MIGINQLCLASVHLRVAQLRRSHAPCKCPETLMLVVHTHLMVLPGGSNRLRRDVRASVAQPRP
jgi:hypothetical protein